MTHLALNTLPSGISKYALTQNLQDIESREVVLQAIVERYGTRYGSSLEALEARLARGEGSEHPDWEDSIEWRNAVESLHRTHVMQRLLQWLLRSKLPSQN